MTQSLVANIKSVACGNGTFLAPVSWPLFSQFIFHGFPFRLCGGDRFACSGYRALSANWLPTVLRIGMTLESRYRRSPTAPLLLGPRMRQRSGEAGDREVRRRGVVDDRCDDAGRHEGEGYQQTNVSFALVFALGNVRRRRQLRPSRMSSIHSPRLGDRGESRGVTALGHEFRLCGGSMYDALHSSEGWSRPGQRDDGGRWEC